MRSLKKFLAVIITVAVMVSMMVPAFAATSAKYEDQAIILNALDLLKGDGTELNLDQPLNRQDGVIMVLRVLGLLDASEESSDEDVEAALAKFSDADEIGAYARKAVAYAVEKGILNGRPDGTFGGTDNLGAKDYAKMLLAGLGYDFVYSTSVFDLVDATESLTAAEAAAMDRASVFTRDLMAGLTYSVLMEVSFADGSGTPFTVKCETDEAFRALAIELELYEDPQVAIVADAEEAVAAYEAAKITTLAEIEAAEALKAAAEEAVALVADEEVAADFADRIAAVDAAIAAAKEKLTAPAVVNVSAANLKEIVVEFNKVLDKTSAENAANYRLDGSALAGTVALNADGKSVTITLTSAFGSNQREFELTVLAGLKAADGSSFADDVSVKKVAFDVNIPVALSAEQDGQFAIKVTFSEPVDAATVGAASFKVDGGQLFVDGSSIVVSGREVTFNLYTTIPVGERKVTVSGVKDFAGYSCVTTDLTFTAAKDETAPVLVKVVKATPDSVVLEFDENIVIDAAATVNSFYHTNSNNVISSHNVTGKQLTLTFATNKLPNGTAYLYIAKDVIKDTWNNKADAINGLMLEVTVDKTKPEVKDVKADGDTKIDVFFTEDVDVLGTYTVLDASGNVVTSPTFTVNRKAGGAQDAITLTFASALPGSNYTVVVEGAKDLAGNEIDKVTKGVAITDSTAPTVNTSGKLYTSKKVAKIEFSEIMKSEDILNLANYQYGADYLSTKKVTVSITDNGKAVLLDFSKELTITLADGDTINVGKVRDAAGNPTAAMATSVTLNDQDSIGIGFDKVEATGKKTLVVTLTDALSSFQATDFSVIDTSGNAIGVAGVSFANVDGKGVITYTLLNELTTTALTTSDGLGVRVATTAGAIGSANAFGVKVGASTASAIAADKIAAEIQGASFDDDTHITITFTETVKADTLSRYTFTVSGNTVIGVSSTASAITLTLKDAVSTTGAKVTVNQVLDIEDALGNVTKNLTKEVTR